MKKTAGGVKLFLHGNDTYDDACGLRLFSCAWLPVCTGSQSFMKAGMVSAR
jgi:hypothetical protein